MNARRRLYREERKCVSGRGMRDEERGGERGGERMYTWTPLLMEMKVVGGGFERVFRNREEAVFFALGDCRIVVYSVVGS